VLVAVPAASTKGSTGRQHVVAARRLPTAEIAAADVPFEGDFVVVLTVSVFMIPAPVFTVWSLAGSQHCPINEPGWRKTDLFRSGIQTATQRKALSVLQFSSDVSSIDSDGWRTGKP
jgi:hypothetical protein